MMSNTTLSKELQKVAKQELNEEPERVNSDIQHILDWLEKKSHLNVRKDKEWLLNFLRCSKFSLQRTKERLEYYHKMKIIGSEFLSDKNPMLPEIQDLLFRGVCLPLLKPARPDGPAVCILRWKQGIPEQNLMIHIIKLLFMFADVLLCENDNFRVSGIEVIQDLEDYPTNYMLQLNPAICKKSLANSQKGYPLRIRKIHCINAPIYYEAILNLLKPFLSEKLKNRILVYKKGELDKLYQHIPREVLPKEYGGSEVTCTDLTIKCKAMIEGYQQWFSEEKLYWPDAQTTLGINEIDEFGSFRKLDID